MIVPQGTEITVDTHGQLSIRTPGNLVLQNSGSFGTLESVHGSIRIDREVDVEAATVRCAETCYVQGSLTAWKVIARVLHLEDTARAHVVLQETESLEIGRGARLVGNFASEDELFGLFARFREQVRSLPVYSSRRRPPAAPARPGEPELVRVLAEGKNGEGGEAAAAESEEAGDGADSRQGDGQLTEPLRFAATLLTREEENPDLSDGSRRVIHEVSKLLDEGDVETLRHTHRLLFDKIPEATDGLRKAEWLIEDHFSET